MSRQVPRLRRSSSLGALDLVVAIGGAGFVAYRWLLDYHFQGTVYTGYFDQKFYISEASVLAHFQLPTAAGYEYPLGYPILGVPFYWLGMRTDPLFIPDILLAGAAAVLAYRLVSRLTGYPGLGVLGSFLFVVGSPFAGLAAIPWSTAVTVVCVSGGLLLVLGPHSPRRALLMGALVGWAFAARPGDLIVMGFLALAYLYRHRAESRWTTVVWMAIPAAALAGLVALTQWAIFGAPWITPYSQHLRPNAGSDQSIGAYSLGAVYRHFLETYVTGFDPNTMTRAAGRDPFLAVTPILVLMPLGFILLLRALKGVERRTHVIVFVGVLAQAVLYLSFRAGGGTDLIYNNARYWIALYPYWIGLGLVAGVAIIGALLPRERAASSTMADARFAQRSTSPGEARAESMPARLADASGPSEPSDRPPFRARNPSQEP